MSDDDVVRLWRDPDSRDGAVIDHPAGELRAGEPSTIGRRAQLLAGFATHATVAAALMAVMITDTSSHSSSVTG